MLAPSKMYLLLIRNTAVESEGDPGQEVRKRDARGLLRVHVYVRKCTCGRARVRMHACVSRQKKGR